MEKERINKQEEKQLKKKYKKEGTKVEVKVAGDAKMSRKEKTFRMCLLALLIAIMLVMNFTPIGYIPIPGFEPITLMPIPVVIGAIVLGPIEGMILGGVFGLTSFLQCFDAKSLLAVTLFGINPFFYGVLCFVPRIAMGFCVSMVYKLLSRIKKVEKIKHIIAAASGAVFNTAFFITFLFLLFGNTAYDDVMGVIAFAIGINFVLEFCVSLVLGGACSLAFDKALNAITKKFK